MQWLLILYGIYTIPLINGDQYRVLLEKALVIRNDSEYVTDNLVCFKYNRTSRALNRTTIIHKEFPPETKVYGTTYEFMNNEYRPFVIKLSTNLCNYMRAQYKKFFYQDIMSKPGSNPYPPTCPVKPGTYTIRNYIPEAKFYPVTLPFKRFMLELSTVLKDRVLLQEQYYIILDRDVMIRERFG